MEAYIYCAALYCEDCGDSIKSDLMGSALDDGDSGSYPQGPYSDGGGESDCPDHCDSCRLFLENPLTSYGYDYVRELLLDHAETGRGAADVLAEWRVFYDMDDGLDEFVDSYIECALWSSNDESDESGGEPFDENYSAADIDDVSLESMCRDCTRFFYANFSDIESDFKQAGHDFWLTRNGHGAGFWDGDWKEPAATHLTDASEVFGECNLYLGDDGRIYI